MRWPCYALITSLTALEAKEAEITLAGDGFAAVHTFNLTGGEICRKLDRYHSPDPAAWHIRPEWNSIHLMPGQAELERGEKKLTEFHGGCQRGFSHTTLIGPLKRGKWQIYGEGKISVGKVLSYSHAREIKKADSFAFKTDEPGILSVLVQYYHNTTGLCVEYVPLILRVDSARGIIEAAPKVPGGGRDKDARICRALPRTVSEAAIEIQPGSYRLLGANISRVTLFLAESGGKMRYLSGAGPMKEEVLRFVPPGTGVEAATSTMQRAGFVCERKTNEDFSVNDHGKPGGPMLRNKNYLYCDHTEPGYILSADRRWQVALIIKDEKISEIYVSYGLIAL